MLGLAVYPVDICSNCLTVIPVGSIFTHHPSHSIQLTFFLLDIVDPNAFFL